MNAGEYNKKGENIIYHSAVSSIFVLTDIQRICFEHKYTNNYR